jgi:hypothetical protein
LSAATRHVTRRRARPSRRRRSAGAAAWLSAATGERRSVNHFKQRSPLT